MNKKIHHINKQFIELHVPSEATAFALQRRIEILTKETIPQMLEVLFDGMCKDEKYIIANKLEIDLGNIRSDQFEKEFSRRLIEQLEEILGNDKLVQTTTTTADPNHPGQLVKIQPQAHLLESFIFFIRNGYLQWNHIEFSFEEINDFFEDVNNPAISPFVEQFKLFLAGSSENAGLFMKRTPAAVADKILRKLFPLTSDVQNAVEFITTVLSHYEPVLIKKEEIQQLFILILAGTEQKENTQMLSASLAREIADVLHLKHDKNEIADLLISLHTNLDALLLTGANAASTFLQALITALHERFVSDRSNNEFSNQRQTFAKKEKIEQIREFKQENPADKKNKIRSEMKPNEAEGIYIGNAGLILFHPFLLKWFELLNCTDNSGNWLTGGQQRAVRLLQLLANGNVNCPEYELCLNKILCGLSMNDEIHAEIEVSPAEKDSAEELMQAVIKHWQALGKSSTAGLQETFVQRTGKLFFANGNWQLHCEEKTVDVLLNKLPWSFSIVKFPWMEEMLRVFWEAKTF